jgi:hypothetical protein
LQGGLSCTAGTAAISATRWQRSCARWASTSREIDVDSDPHLRLKHGRDVPVLVFKDVVFKHRLTPEAIAKLR